MTSDIETKLPTIAAFDFDGTLTYRDTLIPYLAFCCGWPRLIWAGFKNLPALLGYMLGHIDRKQIKEIFLTELLKGLPISQLKESGTAFIHAHINSNLRPKGIERLKWHQSKGHRCILISANLNVNLEAWAKEMGFERLISSEVAADSAGNATGRLAGENCWGPEKRARLEKLLGSKSGYLLYAYGDSRGDQEMLELADFPFLNKFD
jgi:HAD superfamily hydrolase (TIGR01490 family)